MDESNNEKMAEELAKEIVLISQKYAHEKKTQQLKDKVK